MSQINLPIASNENSKAVIPVKSINPATASGDHNLDTFCDQIDLDNNKDLLRSFFKVQELREDFLQRKLKELCNEHNILKAMNVTASQVNKAQFKTPTGFL